MSAGKVPGARLTPHDPTVLALTTVVLLVAAFVAAVIRARRASKTEPMVAVRAE